MSTLSMNEKNCTEKEVLLFSFCFISSTFLVNSMPKVICEHKAICAWFYAYFMTLCDPVIGILKVFFASALLPDVLTLVWNSTLFCPPSRGVSTQNLRNNYQPTFRFGWDNFVHLCSNANIGLLQKFPVSRITPLSLWRIKAFFCPCCSNNVKKIRSHSVRQCRWKTSCAFHCQNTLFRLTAINKNETVSDEDWNFSSMCDWLPFFPPFGLVSGL